MDYSDIVDYANFLVDLIKKYGIDEEDSEKLESLITRVAENLDDVIITSSAYKLFLEIKDIVLLNFPDAEIWEDGDKICINVNGEISVFYYDWFNAWYFYIAPSDVYFYVRGW